LPLTILLFLSSALFVLHHAKHSTSIFVIVLSTVSFGMGSAAVVLLPINLSYASTIADSNYTAIASANEDETKVSTSDTTIIAILHIFLGK
jgi:hypothetical protein